MKFISVAWYSKIGGEKLLVPAELKGCVTVT